jgi:hypothetical protein
MSVIVAAVVCVTVIIVVYVIIKAVKASTSAKYEPSRYDNPSPPPPSFYKEREVIEREIVKIRCRPSNSELSSHDGQANAFSSSGTST